MMIYSEVRQEIAIAADLDAMASTVLRSLPGG